MTPSGHRLLPPEPGHRVQGVDVGARVPGGRLPERHRVAPRRGRGRGRAEGAREGHAQGQPRRRLGRQGAQQALLKEGQVGRGQVRYRLY